MKTYRKGVWKMSNVIANVAMMFVNAGIWLHNLKVLLLAA